MFIVAYFTNLYLHWAADLFCINRQ